jgi:rod shape-determining protein MreC
MAVYTPGRRRAILLLVLTSLLLITIDLRGNALLDTARDGFDRAMRPFEDAAEVVARPVRNAWRGITQYDDLEAEKERLEAQIDAMRTNDIVARSVIDSWRRLLGMEDLESPGDFDRVVASVIGQSPNNLDLIIEINKGSDDGLRVGMPVVNPAGSLIGKVTQTTSDRAQVMLITDTNYAVLVKIVRPERLPAAAAATTTTSAAPGRTPAATTGAPTSSTTSTTSTTLPPTTTTTLPPTTTTLPPTTTLPDPQRETGQMVGRGVAEPPRVDLVDDSPAFGTPEIGDTVLTAGGDRSLAPADIPIGVVSEVRHGSPSEGWILDVDPLAELEGLEFVQVLLYTTETDSPETGG